MPVHDIRVSENHSKTPGDGLTHAHSTQLHRGPDRTLPLAAEVRGSADSDVPA